MVGTPSFFSDYTVCRTILKFVNDKIKNYVKRLRRRQFLTKELLEKLTFCIIKIIKFV